MLKLNMLRNFFFLPVVAVLLTICHNVSVIVKHPVFPPCVVDGHTRNALYYYCYSVGVLLFFWGGGVVVLYVRCQWISQNL